MAKVMSASELGASMRRSARAAVAAVMREKRAEGYGNAAVRAWRNIAASVAVSSFARDTIGLFAGNPPATGRTGRG